MRVDLDEQARRRREPSIGDAWYLSMRPLAARLRDAVGTHVAPLGNKLAVLDVGCGIKPFEPYLAPHSREYVGVDSVPGPRVDVVAGADSLPFPDARFDVVLCIQTLEHVADPAAAIREMHRVLRPGGALFLSTHGTAVYHPVPTDYWRWTQEGLEKVVGDNGNWAGLELHGTGGTMACFGHLTAFYVAAALSRRFLSPLRRAAVASVNLLFGALDRIAPLHHPRKYTLITNFVVSAHRAANDG